MTDRAPTRAVQVLQRKGIAYRLQSYAYDPAADRIGIAAAQALGEPPELVFKTLMIRVDTRPVCALIPSDATLSLKKVAALFDGSKAQMMPPADAERISGYVVGGISPFGQKRELPVAIDRAALDCPYIFLNGGQRGLQLCLDPSDVVELLNARVAAIMD